MNAAQQLESLLGEMAVWEDFSPDERANWMNRARRLKLGTADDIVLLLNVLLQKTAATASGQSDEEGSPSASAWAALLEAIGRTSRATTHESQSPDAAVGLFSRSAETLELVARLYKALGPKSRARHHLLRALAVHDDPMALEQFVELIVSDPPATPEDASLAFVPLFQRRGYDPRSLFPRLLECLEHPVAAAAVLDLANYLTRSRVVSRHPAADRVNDLASLLGGLAQRLAHLQQRPPEAVDDQRRLAPMVNDGVALITSLCDSLALVGDTTVNESLHQVLLLTHRRARTEAAAALARLGDDTGVLALVELAAQPASRTRAIAYLEELDQIQRVDEVHHSPAARAEGDLADWLARPEQFGIAPQNIEVIDSRRQYWPSYDDPVECFLLRYEYRLPRGLLSGIGIAGPAIHAFHADLADLPPDDIYAVYAGWQAEHADIHETTADEMSPEQRAACEEVCDSLVDFGCCGPVLVKTAHFLGEVHVVFVARRVDESGTAKAGVAVVDGRQIHWFPTGTGPRALGPTEVYYLYKGRKLLRGFNPPDDELDENGP